jgi:hypothetical protein
MQLDKFQRNDIFVAIADTGMRPEDFELFETPTHETCLRHPSSGSELRLVRELLLQAGNRLIEVRWRIEDGPQKHRNFGDIQSAVKGWLNELKRSLETPDLWATLREQNDLAGPAVTDGYDNTPFTASEQAEIAKQLDEIKLYVQKTYDLTDEQTRTLEGRLKYLEQAANRMGRIDWRNAAAGVLLSTLVSAMLPSDAARDVVTMLFRFVGHMYGHPLPELSAGI